MDSIPDITVSVESAVYRAIKDVMQAIHDEHGIIVESVRLSWLDFSVCGYRPRSVVNQVAIESRLEFSDVPGPAESRQR